MSRPGVVALGGGHGLAASLAALRLVTDRITAVVTVGDDGGSSGRLREEFDVLPPGDLRMALAALCDDSEWGHQWRDVLQHRFAGAGPLGGHALGNLLIVSLWDLLGDTVGGLDLVGRLLGARGRVLPMAAEPLQIEASVLGADPARPGRDQHGAGPGAGGVHLGAGARRPAAPGGPQAVRGDDPAPSMTRTGSSSAPAPGSPP